MILRLTIEPKFCGPVSVGTINIIKLIKDRCDLGLSEAKEYIDMAVFEGHTVDIPLPYHVDADKLVSDILALESAATFHATLVSPEK